MQLRPAVALVAAAFAVVFALDLDVVAAVVAAPQFVVDVAVAPGAVAAVAPVTALVVTLRVQSRPMLRAPA